MKRSELSLTLILSIFLIFFLIAFFFLGNSFSFSDPDTKKSLLLVVFLIGLISFSGISGSVSKAFLLFFPMLFQLDRALIHLNSILPLPTILSDASIGITDTCILALFFIFFDTKKIINAFTFSPVKYWLYLIFIGLLTLLWCVNTYAGVAGIPGIILLPASYFVFLRFFEVSEKNVKYITYGLLFTGLLSIIFLWPAYFGIKWFSSLISSDEATVTSQHAPTSVRAGGVISRAGMALLLTGIIPFLYNYGLYYYKKFRLPVHGLCLLLILTLVLTLNRMHFATTVFCVCIVLWFAIVKDKIVKANIVAVLLALFAFLVVVVYVITANGNTVENAVTRDTLSGRLLQYQAALANFNYSFGFGIGMNNFLVSPISRAVLGANNWVFRAGATVHNDLLRITAEYGIIGVLCYITFFISIIKIKLPDNALRPMVRGAKINIIALALLGLTSPSFVHSFTLIITGLYLAIIRFLIKSEEEFKLS